MGAGASIQNDAILQCSNEDLKNVYLQVNQLRETIATSDAKLIHGQSGQAWKNHKLLIETLTKRSKSQLQLISAIYKKLGFHDRKYNSVEAEMRDMLGGNYGDLMRMLLLPKSIIDTEGVDNALSCLGCDENAIADIICSSSPDELKETITYFNSAHELAIDVRIRGKTLDKSSFQRFILSVLSKPRPQDSVFDEDNALNQAVRIHDAGSATPLDEDAIFEIITSASRKQCALISNAYEKKFNVTLHKAIHAKFAGSIARALVLWTSSYTEAIAMQFFLALNNPVVNYDEIGTLVAKHDKSTFKRALHVFSSVYDESLTDKLNTSITGHFKKAIISYISAPGCDNGEEDKVNTLIALFGGVEKALQDESAVDQLYKALLNEKNTLDTYVRTLSDIVPPNIPPLHGVSKAVENINPEEEAAAKAITARVENILNQTTHRNEIGYEAKYKLICDYLFERFKQDDLDNSGALDANEFWNTINSLKVGYTPEEVKGIQEWVDWDQDGTITYGEIVNELADSLITVIEGEGWSVEDKITELQKQNQEELSRLWNEYEQWLAQNPTHQDSQAMMPPDLTTYLRDSFNAFDFDNDGMLNTSEFWEVMITMLGLTDGDLTVLQQQWDHDKDGLISWEEAYFEITKMFNESVSDKRDYWLGLVDKSSDNLYWYNLRDGNSFWMTENDMARFKQARENGRPKEHVVPEFIPKLSVKSKSLHSTKSSKSEDTGFKMFRSMKGNKEFKDE